MMAGTLARMGFYRLLDHTLSSTVIDPLLVASPKRTAPMAVDRAAAFFDIAAPIAEAIPALGTPVKAAFDATAKILKYAGVRSCKLSWLQGYILD
jgi:hypothetical protein